MKLLIDIPEHIYEHAKETTEDSRDEFDAMRAIANGTQQESRSEIPNTCGDAISREAAIEIARSNIPYRLDKEHEYARELLQKTMTEINSLPSVTPEPIECEERKSGNCPFYAN